MIGTEASEKTSFESEGGQQMMTEPDKAIISLGVFGSDEVKDTRKNKDKCSKLPY